MGKTRRLETRISSKEANHSLCLCKDGDKEIFVNEEMICSGCASIYRRNRKDHILEHKYSEHFATLEQEAKSKRLGIWDIQAKLNGVKWHCYRARKINVRCYEGYFHREGCPRLSDLISRNIEFYILSSRKSYSRTL